MPKNVNRFLLSLLSILLMASLCLAVDETFPGPDDFVPVEQMPEMIYEEPPVYPASARENNEEATVYINALIDKTGAVRKSMVVKSTSDNEAFEQAALDASYKNRFKPALQNTVPIACWVTYKVKFALEDESYPAPDEFIKVEKAAEMIYEAKPEYPRLAKEAGIEGSVWVKALVDKKGDVVKAVIHKSSGSKNGFDKAALDAAYKNRFKPAIQDGKSVAVWVAYNVKFVLDDKK